MQPPPPPRAIQFHSIIGSYDPPASTRRPTAWSPIAAAHLDGVASEKIVRSDHGVQKDPEAIREVRRILREHVGVAPDRPGGRPGSPRHRRSPRRRSSWKCRLP